MPGAHTISNVTDAVKRLWHRMIDALGWLWVQIIDALGWLWPHVWSWPVVGLASTFIYGLGVAAMFGDQYIVAALFHFLGIAYLTTKISTGEDTPAAASVAVVLIGLLLFAASLVWVRARQLHVQSIQGNVAVGSQSGTEDAPKPGAEGLGSRLTEILGNQKPRIVQTSPNLMGPDRLLHFWYFTGRIEGRRVFGRKILLDLRAEEQRNRLLVYLHTRDDINYLTHEVFTNDGDRYSVSHSIAHWKDNGKYPIGVSWSNISREITIYLDGALAGLIKTRGTIFEAETATLLLY